MAERKNISMRIVKERTGLSSRQIRYYDQKGLIFPARTKGNQRLFSERDIRRLERIKDLLKQGYKMEIIKKKLNQPQNTANFINSRLQRYNKGDLISHYPELKKKITRSEE